MAVLGTFLALLLLLPLSAWAADEDPFQWLEEIQGDKALAWAKKQNQRTTQKLEAQPVFKPTYERTLEILNSKEKIPVPEILGPIVYNFWKDETHERGIWRRTSLPSYRSEAPLWETVLDVDALAKAEGVPWVFQSGNCLYPDYRRCLVSLSKGGSDAAVVREFDTVQKAFVKEGFLLPEAKSFVSWRDEDTLWVGTDFGPGSLTKSGYPRVVKLWRRGTPLGEATTVFEAKEEDVGAMGSSQFTKEGRYDVVTRIPAFYRHESFLVLGGRLVKLGVPEDSELRGVFKDQLLLSLRTDWKTSSVFKAGSLLAISIDDFLAGSSAFQVLFEPAERTSLGQVASTRDRVLVTILDNVRSRLRSLTFEGKAWKSEEVALPGLGTASLPDASDTDDLYFVSYQDFLTPSSLWIVEKGSPLQKVKAMPTFFDASGMAVSQHEATSKDGTKVPYFMVTAKGFEANGTAPTLLYGYGGFEVPQLPTYSGARGGAWLARGGVFVLANIRGGGEFGPAWHEAALKENRMKAYEDFIAIAEDLVERRVTSPAHLGIEGGSQGGLLVGATFLMRPELFSAVVAQVPLADMKRYSHLLAGASWIAEYGDPDVPEEWAYIQRFSPYHLVSKDKTYPTPFYWTNTRDDRVHPGHARKMVAKMEALGHPVYYFENLEGGHGAGVVNKDTAYVTALEYAYLWERLK